MNFKKVSKKYLGVHYLLNVIFFLIVLGGFILLLVKGLKYFYIPYIGVLVLFIFINLVLPALRYQKYRYYYDEKTIVLSRGVIFKSHIVIPVCQIQDLHLYHGPISDLFKVANVDISTAGSNYSIECLEKDVAQSIIEDLLSKLESRIEEIKNEALQ